MSLRRILASCLLLLLPGPGLVPAADLERIDALIALLDDPDPGRRAAALLALAREGPEAAERMCDYLDHPEPHLRRIVNERLHAVMLRGGSEERLQVIRGLIRAGEASRVFLPLLEEIGEEPNEVGWLAQVAQMRLLGNRQNVERLANTPEALQYLREFDPVRADALALVADLRIELSGLPGGELAGQMRSAQTLLAQAHPGFTGFLAARLQRSEDSDLVEWLRVAAELRPVPGGIGPSLAHRIEHGSRTALCEMGRRLQWKRRMDGEISYPVRRAAWKRLRDFPGGEARTHLLRILDACEYPEAELLPLLERECTQDDAVGVTAAALLAGRTPTLGPGPVAVYTGLPDLERRAVLNLIAHSGSAVYFPVFEHVLKNGAGIERGTALERAHEMEECVRLLPALRHCQLHGSVWEAGRAVRAAARCDPALKHPLSERMLTEGLADERREVRRSAVYACDELARVTPEIAAGLEGLLEDPSVMRPMTVFIGNAHRLRRNGLPLVPLLVRIVEEGPPDAMRAANDQEWKQTWIRRAIDTMGRIDPSDPRVRGALRSALRSDRYWIRHFALRVFERMRRPGPEDVAALRELKEALTQGQDLNIALGTLQRWERG